MSTQSPNTFGITGLSVRMEYEHANDSTKQEDIEATPLPTDEDEYPLVAKGRFNSNGVWFVYKTNTHTAEYDLEYPEFISAVEETKPQN